MLIVQPKARIVEKIVRNKDGNFVRAYFLVAEFEGKIFWKLIKVEEPPRGVLKSAERTPLKGLLLLPIFRSPKTYKLKNFSTSQLIPSPYFLKTFFTSQMTRAPSK